MGRDNDSGPLLHYSPFGPRCERSGPHAQLYAAFTDERRGGSKLTRSFNDAVAMHRLIDAIVKSSSISKTISMEAHA